MKNIFILCLCLATLLCAREISLLPDGQMHVYMLDVSQGDSFLVVTPSGKHILIDGGPSLSALTHLGTYLSFLDRTIELVVITHPDADHITAIPSILHRYKIERVMLSGAVHSSGKYEELLQSIADKKISVLLPDPEKDIEIDGVTLDVIWPPPSTFGASPRSQNNQSIVFRMLHGKDSILFTGDIEHGAEKDILSSGADIQANIMTAPHHGSRTSSSTGFILQVKPSLVLISAGKDNRYGHPHKIITDRYQSLGIPIKTTPEHGTVSIEF